MFTSQIINENELSDWYDDDADPALLDAFLNDDEYSSIFSKWISLYTLKGHKKMSKHIAKKKHYYYMVTFTLPDTYDKALYDRAKKYIFRQHKRKALSMVKYFVVEELTKKGVPHWHCGVKTTRPISKCRFSQYSDSIAYVDFSPKTVPNFDSTIKYLSKGGKHTNLL